ncbi:MAG: excinuclease ABC subunit C, partial [Bacteroidaceae bacterium]|nr:excinuclease ABC subunit C [Bacteroidaceae bacterium]
ALREMRYEEAAVIKRKYELLGNYCSRSEVVNNTVHNVDVFNIENGERIAYINYLHVVNGCITQAFTFELCKRLDETDEDILLAGIAEMRERYPSGCKEIIIPFPVELSFENVSFTIPLKGDKKKLLELSKLNVLQYKKDRLLQADKLNPEQKGVRLMKELQEALQLSTLPLTIECFDNSHISGTSAVAACVVFKKCKPSKQDYRKYIIQGGEGGDDYASMKEVVRRRYTRLQEEGGVMPDLIVADGGIGQMNVVREVVEDELHLSIPIAGLAKDDKHRTNELLYGFPPQVVGMSTPSNLFRLLTNLQDEAHRFAIKFHREKRERSQTASALDEIPGIGSKTKKALLEHYRSVKRVK